MGGPTRVTCPFDKNHHVLKCRLAAHIIKCQKHYDMSNKLPCKFNSAHLVHKEKLESHHLTCPDRRDVIAYEFKSDEYYYKKWMEWDWVSVRRPMKALSDLPVTTGENWDNDPEVGTYDPYKVHGNKYALTSLIVAPKSEKEAEREDEREKMAQFPNSECSEIKSAEETQTSSESRPVPPAITSESRPVPAAITPISVESNDKSVDPLKKETRRRALRVVDQLIISFRLL